VGLSEGYSGADIASVCNDVATLGLRRMVDGKTPDEIRKITGKEPATRADFETVFLTVRSSAGKADLQKYRDWMRGPCTHHTPRGTGRAEWRKEEENGAYRALLTQFSAWTSAWSRCRLLLLLLDDGLTAR
jgi:hypothetical protein